MMTQPPDLDATSTLAREAKARADRATPGPWVCGERWQRGPKNKRRDTHPALTAIASVGLGQCVLTEHDGGVYPTNDQKFIAAARTDVTALADAVLALVERVSELEAGPVMPEVPDGKLLLSAGAMVDAHPVNVLGFFESIRAALLKEQGAK